MLLAHRDIPCERVNVSLGWNQPLQRRLVSKPEAEGILSPHRNKLCAAHTLQLRSVPIALSVRWLSGPVAHAIR